MPLFFLAYEYYNSGSMIHSILTCARDFFWPGAVCVAKMMNASPYQMLATNVGGIVWTIYNCFFTEHDDLEEEHVNNEMSSPDFSAPSSEASKMTARLTLKQKW